MSLKSGIFTAVNLLSSLCVGHIIPGAHIPGAPAPPVPPVPPVIPPPVNPPPGFPIHADPVPPIAQNPPPPPVPTLPAAAIQATCGQVFEGLFQNGANIGLTVPYAADLIFYINGDTGVEITSIKAFDKDNALTPLKETPLYAVNYLPVPDIHINDNIIFDVSGIGMGPFWALVRCTERITTAMPTAKPTPPPVPPPTLPFTPLGPPPVLPPNPVAPVAPLPPPVPVVPNPVPVGPVPVGNIPLPVVPVIPHPAQPLVPAIQCQCGKAFNGQYTGERLVFQAAMSVTGSMTLYVNNIGIKKIKAYNLAYNNNIPIAETPRAGIYYLSLPNIQANTNMKFEIDAAGPPGEFFALVDCRAPTPAPTIPVTTTTMMTTTTSTTMMTTSSSAASSTAMSTAGSTASASTQSATQSATQSGTQTPVVT